MSLAAIQHHSWSSAVFELCLRGDMGGKANKVRRKQERLRQRRQCQQGEHPGVEPAAGDVCRLYQDQPGGELYRSWMDCGSPRKAIAWSEAALRDRRAADPDVADLARRMPYLASIYGRMVPVGAAWQLDRHLDEGNLPVQWTPGRPVTIVPAAQMAPGVTDGSPAETRVAIHDLHARGYLLITDDGTVIPVVPARPDLTGSGSYDPDRYRLARAPRAAPWPQMVKKYGARDGYECGYPVTGIIWNQQEFLALPWVQDYLSASGLPGSEHDPRGQICGRYGEKIPADLAVIDMAADDTTVIAVANARSGYLEPAHLRAFTGVDNVRDALRQLSSQKLLLPLSNGLVLAPDLILELVPAD